MTSSANPFVGSWRVGYVPGSWTVLAGPASVVAVSTSADAERLWSQVLGATAIEDLLPGVVELGPDQAPDLFVAFWADGELRTLVRGDVEVRDRDGSVLVQGAEVRTWSETGLGEVRQISISLGGSTPEGSMLPLVVGAVSAGALALDASDEALVLSPQVRPVPAVAAAEEAPAPLVAVPEPESDEPESDQPESEPNTSEEAEAEEAAEADGADEFDGVEEVQDGASEIANTVDSVPDPDDDLAPEDDLAPRTDAAAAEPSADDAPTPATAPDPAADPQTEDDTEVDAVSAAAAAGAVGAAGAAGAVAAGVAGAGGGAAAPLPYSGSRREQTTTPEPESAGAYGTPEAEPNGATAPQVDSVAEHSEALVGETVQGGHLQQAKLSGRLSTFDPAIGAGDAEAVDPEVDPSADESGFDVAGGEPAEGVDVVLAVFCPHGHPNPPDQSTCRWCGTQIERQQPQLVEAPVLAVLTTPGGDRMPLTGPIVIGRAPRPVEVGDGESETLTVPSPSQDISRSHALVAPEGWDVTVTDLQSTNGTILIAPGDSERRRLPPGEPVTVELGSVLDLGDGATVEIAVPS